MLPAEAWAVRQVFHPGRLGNRGGLFRQDGEYYLVIALQKGLAACG